MCVCTFSTPHKPVSLELHQLTPITCADKTVHLRGVRGRSVLVGVPRCTGQDGEGHRTDEGQEDESWETDKEGNNERVMARLKTDM
ncbi:hypothetical protein E2C01_005715 [Portunus trituberculatus]|uniref:Uncharacterized protein n=1 Tax=Portunus trituberculatus TaxID=210409 RepID=A0A5B7CT43_PORTR|nr:hypothetical protein [Portunus trituberculatus]